MDRLNRRTFVAAAAAASVLSGRQLSGAVRSTAGPVRVGQIGTRHAHAAGKLAALRKYPDLFDVVGIAEHDARQRRRLEREPAYAGLPWLSVEQLLETPGLQAVAVETQVDELLDVAERCVDAGMHVHLDKPAGVSLPHFQRICDEADANGLLIQMGYMFRSNPAFRFLFKAVCEGLLGDIFHVHGEISKNLGDERRPELARYKGGSMFELGCHLIDGVLTVLGPPERVTPFNRNTRPDQDDLMDTCLAVFEYPRATATVRSSLVEVDGDRRRQFVVCGTKGTIVIRPLEPPQLTLTLETDHGGYKRGTHTIELSASPGRYDRELIHLARVIRGEEQAEFGTAHDLAVQRAVLEASAMPLN